jgi:hypothetical protein
VSGENRICIASLLLSGNFSLRLVLARIDCTDAVGELRSLAPTVVHRSKPKRLGASRSLIPGRPGAPRALPSDQRPLRPLAARSCRPGDRPPQHRVQVEQGAARQLGAALGRHRLHRARRQPLGRADRAPEVRAGGWLPGLGQRRSCRRRAGQNARCSSKAGEEEWVLPVFRRLQIQAQATSSSTPASPASPPTRRRPVNRR